MGDFIFTSKCGGNIISIILHCQFLDNKNTLNVLLTFPIILYVYILIDSYNGIII